MPEKLTISHRGAKYEIGRGKRYYGIWVTGAPESDPIDRWPETRDGWTQAWTRFTAIETPGTIEAASRPRAGFTLPRLKAGAKRPRDAGSARALAGAGLLGLGVLLGLIGLFPGYIGSPSLASQAGELVPHLCYLAAWAASAVLIAVGARSSRPGMAQTGTLLGIGLSAVTFGLFFADLGEVISGGASLLGAGLVLSLLGWAACAAGSALAFTARPGPGSAPDGAVRGAPAPGSRVRASGPVRPRAHHAGPIALLLLAAVGTVAAFVPCLGQLYPIQASTGSAQTITAGNAFSNPGPVIAGDVVVMLAVVAVAVLAALWRPARQGAVLLAGAIVPLAAQAISGAHPGERACGAVNVRHLAGAGIGRRADDHLWCHAHILGLLRVRHIAGHIVRVDAHGAAVSGNASAGAAAGAGPADPAQSVAGEADDSDDDDSDDGAEEDEESTYA